jgi:hypothetical protein
MIAVFGQIAVLSRCEVERQQPALEINNNLD